MREVAVASYVSDEIRGELARMIGELMSVSGKRFSQSELIKSAIINELALYHSDKAGYAPKKEMAR